MPLSQAIIPNVVDKQTLYVLGPGATAFQAANMMIEHDISSILIVINDLELIGIVTERDMTRKVVAAGLSSETTLLEEIMTKAPTTLVADDTVFVALETMRELRVRHLPVTKDNHLVGIVTMRDVRHVIAKLPNQKSSLWSRLKHKRHWIQAEGKNK